MYTFIYICMHIYSCAVADVWRPEDNLESVPAFYLMSSVDRFQVTNLDSKHPHPSSWLALTGWTFCGCGCFTAAVFFLSALITKMDGEG